MMKISIIWNWKIVYEEKEFCEENSLKMLVWIIYKDRIIEGYDEYRIL